MQLIPTLTDPLLRHWPMLVPALYLAAAMLAALPIPLAARWRLAGAATGLALVPGLLAPVTVFTTTGGDTGMPGLLVLALVTFLGWVILRFSRPYLAGEACQGRFLPALLFTLAAVATVALTDHLGMLAAAWSAASLGLHRLLRLYPERPGALIAAHKHFVASRLADLALVGAVVLIARQTGTLSLSALAQNPPAMDDAGLQVAAVLLALAALIRCAQLPMHGWLIQVMEAPTPVSALLHAGVVNLAGLVLIRTAWLLDGAGVAQWLLLVIGGLTAVIAALVMIAQTSIKTRLAWSTSAQMGFMLVECALGAYSLALLHLLGHSLYKAHAFLGAGGRVARARRAALHPPANRQVPRAGLALPLLLATALALLPLAGTHPHTAAVLLLVTLVAITPLLGALGTDGPARPLASVFTAAAVVALALLWHQALLVLTGPIDRALTQPAQMLWVALLFLGLMALQVRLLTRPADALARRWRPLFAAGLQLDDYFTRFSLWLWPGRIPRTPPEPVSTSPWQQKENSA